MTTAFVAQTSIGLLAIVWSDDDGLHYVGTVVIDPKACPFIESVTHVWAYAPE